MSEVAVISAYPCDESRCSKQSLFNMKKPPFWRMRRRTRSGTQAAKKLIRHIKCVKLKVITHHDKPGVIVGNFMSLSRNEPAMALFNVISFINISSSDFISKYNKVIVGSRHKPVRCLSRNINFHNLHIIKLRSPYQIVQSLSNKAIHVAEYVVSLTET